MRSFLAVLLFTAVQIFAQPLVLRDERPVSAVEYGEHAEGTKPKIASGGDGYLAVWTDNRGAWATRLTAGGEVLDPLGIYLGKRHARGVLWTGALYLVVVTDAIVALHPDGTKQAEYSLHPWLYADDREVRLATNSTSVLVVGKGDALRLQLDGKPIGRVTLAQSAFFENVGVASNGNDYVVAWSADPGVKVQRVTASGVAAAAVVLDAENFVPHVAIAGNGTSYVVVWTTTAGSLFAQEIGGDVQTLSARRTVDSAGWPDFLGGPRVEWRGGDYLVTYARNDSLQLATRLTAHADPIAAPVAYADSSNRYGAGDLAVNDGGGGAFVWIDPRGVRAGVFDAQSIAGARPVRTNAQVSRAAHAQDAPSVVGAGNSVIIGWAEVTELGRELRLTTPGRREPLAVYGVNPFTFALLTDDSFLWILWTEGLTLNVRRYTHALLPVDSQPWRFAIPAHHGTTLAAAAGERGVIAVWQTTTEDRELAATTIRIEGDALVATETDLVTGNDNLPDREPVVAWSGSEYVVAWVHLKGVPWWQFPQPVPEDVLAVRVTREGLRVDAVPIVVEQRTPTFLWPLSIAPAIGGGVVLTWSDPQNSYATIFRGQPLPEVRNLGEHRSFRMVGLRAVPSGYLLLQSDVGFKAYDVSMRLQRLSTAFVPDGAPLTITGEPDAKILGYSAATIGDALVLAYFRETTEPRYTGQRRVFLRHGDLPTGRRRAVR